MLFQKLSFLIVFIFLFNGCAVLSPDYKKNGKYGQDHEKIKIIHSLHIDKFRWMKNRNIDSLSEILHKDVFYIHSNGWKETREEVLNNLSSEKLTYHDITVNESETRIFGNTGIVTGKGLFKVSLDNKPLEINLYYTEVYVFEGKNIYLISRHATRL
ncbi:MAG: nuclear transport factor 2 family protein [Saprospiraceae bacterium]|nr:nuclear transport factor 2 family protein [Saprospiraceae bacterium]MBK9043696.1 nuclear transport factor 2 family protein [Saprospiraceae bacterium]